MSAQEEVFTPPREGSPPSESAPPSESSTTSASRPTSWAGKLSDGENYRVIRGKKANSKIIVSGDKCYLIEKSSADKSSSELLGHVYYLKCQDPDCLARAIIKRNVLELKTSDERRHTCSEENSMLDKIAIQEALNRMKSRARVEGTTYYVSVFSFRWMKCAMCYIIALTKWYWLVILYGKRGFILACKWVIRCYEYVAILVVEIRNISTLRGLIIACKWVSRCYEYVGILVLEGINISTLRGLIIAWKWVIRCY